MSLSVPTVGQSSQPRLTQKAKITVSDHESEGAKTPAKYGSTPAVAISISAQIKAAQAKALAIKNDHDPDGVQDGK